MIQEKKKGSFLPFLWTLLVISILLNGYLWYSKGQISKQSDQQQIQLDEAEQLNAELEKQYYEALADLEELRSDNQQLNAVIESQKQDLTAQKDRISRLIQDSNNYKAAKAEIAKLKEQAESYVAELETLKSENSKLLARYQELNLSNESLQEQMVQEKMMNDELTTAKAALVGDVERLKSDNVRLAKKVDKASVVDVENITVRGIMAKSSGKEVIRKKADDIERLEICFDALDNEITDPGIEQFFVRILNPRGETLAIENLGSGVIHESESGEPIQYTQLKGIKYENQIVQTCLNWEPNMAFESGNYTIEIYNKGFLAGTSAFTLK